MSCSTYLLDSKWASAILELEQDDVRGIRYDGTVWAKKVRSKRLSHGAREQYEAKSEHNED